MADVIKNQLRATNANIFQHGMIFNPKSKKLIEKEFLIELFLCNNSFANLKLAFQRGTGRHHDNIFLSKKGVNFFVLFGRY